MTQTNLLAGKTGTQQLSSVSVQTLADKPGLPTHPENWGLQQTISQAHYLVIDFKNF